MAISLCQWSSRDSCTGDAWSVANCPAKDRFYFALEQIAYEDRLHLLLMMSDFWLIAPFASARLYELHHVVHSFLYSCCEGEVLANCPAKDRFYFAL